MQKRQVEIRDEKYAHSRKFYLQDIHAMSHKDGILTIYEKINNNITPWKFTDSRETSFSLLKTLLGEAEELPNKRVEGKDSLPYTQHFIIK